MSDQEVTAKLAIHDLLARASYALDMHDMEALEACFTEDAVFDIHIAGVEEQPHFDGREEIMGLMRGAAEQQSDVRRHVTTNVFIGELTQGHAQTTANLTLTGVEDGQIRLITSGYYKDQLRWVDGRWLIAERRIELDMPY